MLTGLSLLTLVYIFFLLPLLVIKNNIDQQQLLTGIGIWSLCCFISLIPSLNVIIKKSWFFPGKGEPVIHSLLLSLLQEVNTFNSPVTVIQKKEKLIVTWETSNNSWQNKLEAKQIKSLYELHLYFDNNTKTVAMSDRYRLVKWDFFSKSIKKGWFSFPKPFFHVQTGREWGIENYRESKPEAYNFMPEEIKSPLLNTITQNGWNVCFTIF